MSARSLLAPLGWAYGGAAAARAALYRSGVMPREALRGPVVSVGNIAVGGRGKTPMVALVAATLREAGAAVSVLSRGYGGAYRGPALLVSDGARVFASAEDAGDEPVMLARRLPGVVVAVGRRRVDAGREVERRFGPCVHVLDDGFQHLALRRDLDLVCVTAADFAGRPLPAGVLREFPSALSRAGLVLLERENGPVAVASDGPRVLGWRRRVAGFVTLAGAAAPAPSLVLALSGIARPERFTADLRAAGCTVAGEIRHRDHHRYRDADLRAAEKEAARLGAEAIVTTEKDVVRLPEPAGRVDVLALRIEPALDDAAPLREALLALARRAA